MRAGALLLLLVACSKPSEVSAAGGGNSTPSAKTSGAAPAVPAKAEPAPSKDNAGTPSTAPSAISAQTAQEAATAAAPPPATTGEVVDAQVIIWGGGRTPEEGRKALERFEAERSGLEALLSLGEGYPRVVASDALPGLKPGFHVVMLGACKPEEGKEPLQTLQAFKPGVYARTVKMALAPGSCPRRENELGWAGTERVAEKPYELSAVAFMALDPSASKVPWLVRLYLRDAAGALVDQDAVDPRDGIWAGSDRNSCSAVPEAEGSSVRITVECDNLAGGGGPSKRHEEFIYRIKAGQIEWVSKGR